MIITLAKVATEFLDRETLKQNTLRSYEATLLPLLERYGRSPIQSLTRPVLEDYLSSLNHLSWSTYNRHQSIIQALFTFAVDRGYLHYSPIAHLKRRKSDKNQQSSIKISYLTPDNLKLLYDLLEPNSRLHTLILLLHRTGATVTEILALDLEQMNLRDRVFPVFNKSQKQRWCSYDEAVADVLANYLRLYRHSGHPALFTAQQPFSKVISRLSYRAAYQDWKDIIIQSPTLQNFRLQDLRHTFAMERIGAIGIEALKDLMGHESLQTTMQYLKSSSQHLPRSHQ
ncbi:MAG: tyrosine-type recombinase/integrase [Snowella sp.]|nr:tyrosine-type recombinase/integrase [Snowella sp.]